MKVNVKIKDLPKEFDFKSNINTMGLIYHAKEMDDEYVVTVADNMYIYDKEEFHKYFVRKEFVVCN